MSHGDCVPRRGGTRKCGRSSTIGTKPPKPPSRRGVTAHRYGYRHLYCRHEIADTKWADPVPKKDRADTPPGRRWNSESILRIAARMAHGHCPAETGESVLFSYSPIQLQIVGLTRRGVRIWLETLTRAQKKCSAAAN